MVSTNILLNYLTKNWENFVCMSGVDYKTPKDLLAEIYKEREDAKVKPFIHPRLPSDYHQILPEDYDLDVDTLDFLYREGLYKLGFDYKDHYGKFPDKLYLYNTLKDWFGSKPMDDIEDDRAWSIVNKVVYEREINCIQCGKKVLTSITGLVLCKDCE
jgi:hypothetical protein